jgi:hypothetical protein
MLKTLRPYASLTILGLVFFVDLLIHPTEVLYSDSSDVLALHLPDKMFLAKSFQQTGELPLWSPHRFAGVPFIHDFQVGAFYPLHWPLLFLPEQLVGAGMSWLVVIHILVAGWSMFAYARWKGLGELGSYTAAVGFMFSGKMMLHVLVGGHFNMLMLAWTPLVMLLFERAIATRESCSKAVALSAAAGGVFSMIVLAAYPYVTCYAGMLVVFWTFLSIWDRATGDGKRWQNELVRWIALGFVSGTVALLCSAVQWMPGVEAAFNSTRAGAVADPFADGVMPLLMLIGPSLLDAPANLQWESRGGFGLHWIAAAVVAAVVLRGRARREATVAMFLVAFALGGVVLLHWVPGVAAFRFPSRFFLAVAFPVSILAGRAVQWMSERRDDAQEWPLVRTAYFKSIVWLAGLCFAVAGLALLADNLHLGLYWFGLLLTIPFGLWLFSTRCRWTPESKANALVLVLIADLWSLSMPCVETRPLDSIYPPSKAIAFLKDHRSEGRVLDFDQFQERAPDDRPKRGLFADPPLSAIPMASPLGSGAAAASINGLSAVRGFNPIDVRWYKEFLQSASGRDGRVPSLDPSNPFGFPALGNFPIPNRNLIDLLGVKYAVVPASLARIFANGWEEVLSSPNERAFALESGMVDLEPFNIYRSTQAMPRAFVVGESVSLSASPKHAEIAKTDFRATVLLEGAAPSGSKQPMRTATIAVDQPNRIVIDVPPGPAGFLVLTVVWYPGWTCTVDGVPAECRRANVAFRAVEIPENARQVEFRFLPPKYLTGRMLSAVGVGLLIAAMMVGGLHACRR